MPSETISHAAIRARAISVAVSAAIGLLLLTAHPLAVAATCGAPAIWLLQRDRLSAYLCACSYYAAAIWPVVQVMYRFSGSWFQGALVWAAAVLILSIPWLAFHTRHTGSAIWRSMAASLLSVIPPLGFINVACPISASGLLFPACGIAGLLLASALPGLLASNLRRAIIVGGISILIAQLYRGEQQVPRIPWQAVNTNAQTGGTNLDDFQHLEMAFELSRISNATILVFPEATIRTWTSTTPVFFSEHLNAMQSQGKSILIGALMPATDGTYKNMAVLLGRGFRTLDQRVPVPLAMWQPFTHRGAALNPFAPGVLDIEDQKAAILICYEQLIPWPAVLSTFFRPTVPVGIANDYWIRQTRIPFVQSAYLHAWGRLWVTPVVGSVAR